MTTQWEGAGVAPGRPPVAFVTGAGSGIGAATARRLAREGWRLGLYDLDSDGLAATAAGIDAAGIDAADRCRFLPGDVRDVAALSAALERTEAELGGLSALVNVAGIGVAATVDETDPADWDRILAVNLTAVFHACRLVLPRFVAAGGGLIVNVASVAGLVGVRRRAAYCASKAGVIGLTRAIAVDYAAVGVRANAICPGTVASPWIEKILANAPDPVAARRAMDERQLDGRMGTPEEVAAGIAFLLSADARFVNGSAFVMDGGMTAL
jgi:NAD(P)-dependent dehydrogenase (short-subunit alcohol dehydrogenase family)